MLSVRADSNLSSIFTLDAEVVHLADWRLTASTFTTRVVRDLPVAQVMVSIALRRETTV